MAQPDKSIEAFVKLGEFLRGYTSGGRVADRSVAMGSRMDKQLAAARAENAWFTEDEVRYALQHWGSLLREDLLKAWLAPYPEREGPPGTVALVLAGNIPLVGFHDFLSVLLTGHRALVKCSSTDSVLLPFFSELLTGFMPGLASRVQFTDGNLKGYDAVIATGSNNTSRYFEYYFGNRPHIIRKSRSSAAVLTGTETRGELLGLADDIFRYFGMGCRSVSKVFVPEGYDFDPLFDALYSHKHRIDHHKYANNYDYNKAIYLLSGSDMLDNGFLLLKRDSGLASPIGTLFFETYDSLASLQHRLAGAADSLQCVVGPESLPGAVPFGQSQHPGLATYADGADTIEFLLETSVDEASA